MTTAIQTVKLEEFSVSATATALIAAMKQQRIKAAPEPVGFMVASDVWEHVLYRADVLTEIRSDRSLLGYSGFLGLPVAVDAELKPGTVDIVYDAATLTHRMQSARPVAPRANAAPRAGSVENIRTGEV